MSSPYMWDLVATAYEAEVAPMFETFAKKALELAQVAPLARIIDVACGPGTLTAQAVAAGHPVQAIDYSPKMIERLVARNLPGVTAIVGDGENLPFAPNMFGGAFSLFGLMFFDDRAKGFAELARVLEPKQKAVVTSWPGLDENPLFSAIFGAVRDALVKDGLNEVMQPARPPGLTSIDEISREMSVSFRDVEITRISHRVLFPSVEELAASIGRTMAPIAVLRDAVGAERFKAADAALLEAVSRVIGSAPPALDLIAQFGVGTSGAA